MKVNCEHCKKDMTSTVFQTITKNDIGRVVCPHCKKENKRYISELDLMYVFFLNSIIYGLVIMAFTFATVLATQESYEMVFWVSIVITLGCCYFFSKWNSTRQYVVGMLKHTWKNKVFDENSEEVGRRMNFNLVIFIFIAIVLGTDAEMFYLFLFMYLAFILITAIKVHLLYKNELSKQTNN